MSSLTFKITAYIMRHYFLGPCVFRQTSIFSYNFGKGFANCPLDKKQTYNWGY